MFKMQVSAEARALGHLLCIIPPNAKAMIAREDDPAVAWKIIEQKCAIIYRKNIEAVKLKRERLQQGPQEKITKYMNRFWILMAEFQEAGEPMRPYPTWTLLITTLNAKYRELGRGADVALRLGANTLNIDDWESPEGKLAIDTVIATLLDQLSEIENQSAAAG